MTNDLTGMIILATGIPVLVIASYAFGWVMGKQKTIDGESQL